MKNRIIKFRAWDGEHFYPDESVCKDLSRGYVWKQPGETQDITTIEQFTGLLDKNGKEIYEGDILMETDNAGYMHWNSMGGYYQLVEVGRNGCPDLEVVEGSTPKLAVIGNIHENPDLLK